MQSLSDFYTSQNINADGTPSTGGGNSGPIYSQALPNQTSGVGDFQTPGTGDPFSLYNGMNMAYGPLNTTMPSSGDPNNPDFTINSSGVEPDTGAPVDNGVGNNVPNGSGGIQTGSSTTTSPSVMDDIARFLGISNPTQAVGQLGAVAQAIQNYKNAGQYTDIARQASTMANPFGPYRDQAAQRLLALEKNPAEIANTPGYQFSMNQALDQAGNKMGAEGLTGSTQIQQGLANTASGLAQKTYNDTISQLENQAGTQFSPDAAAGLLASGLQDSMAARNMSLQDLFAPYSAQGTQPGSTLQPGGSGGSSSGGGFTMPNLGGLGSGGGIQPSAPIVNAGSSAPTSGEFAPVGTGDSGTPDFSSGIDSNGNDIGSSNDLFGSPGGV